MIVRELLGVIANADTGVFVQDGKQEVCGNPRDLMDMLNEDLLYEDAELDISHPTVAIVIKERAKGVPKKQYEGQVVWTAEPKS